MATRLVKHGEQYALPIDGELLELLAITADTPLQVTVENGELRIVPGERTPDDATFNDALADTNAKYEGMLKRLAE